MPIIQYEHHGRLGLALVCAALRSAAAPQVERPSLGGGRQAARGQRRPVAATLTQGPLCKESFEARSYPEPTLATYAFWVCEFFSVELLSPAPLKSYLLDHNDPAEGVQNE